jgi:hypothetical protein
MQDTKGMNRRMLLKMLMAGFATVPLLDGRSVWAGDGYKTARMYTRQVGATRNIGCCLLDNRLSRELLSQSRLSALGGGDGYESSGNTRFDRALGMMLANLAGRFQVRPGFGFYDDSGSPNALALKESKFPDSHGTVLFGLKMIEAGLRGKAHGDMFVMGICAHEFGHIVQFFSSYYTRLVGGHSTQKLVELHADFLSGYYIGLRNVDYSIRELVDLGRSWEALGDSDYTNINHHGTAEERLRAIEAGFKFARERPEFGIKEACEIGARYLRA